MQYCFALATGSVRRVPPPPCRTRRREAAFLKHHVHLPVEGFRYRKSNDHLAVTEFDYIPDLEGPGLRFATFIH